MGVNFQTQSFRFLPFFDYRVLFWVRTWWRVSERGRKKKPYLVWDNVVYIPNKTCAPTAALSPSFLLVMFSLSALPFLLLSCCCCALLTVNDIRVFIFIYLFLFFFVSPLRCGFRVASIHPAGTAGIQDDVETERERERDREKVSFCYPLFFLLKMKPKIWTPRMWYENEISNNWLQRFIFSLFSILGWRSPF